MPFSPSALHARTPRDAQHPAVPDACAPVRLCGVACSYFTTKHPLPAGRLDQIDWDAWFYSTGLPPVANAFDGSARAEWEAVADSWYVPMPCPHQVDAVLCLPLSLTTVSCACPWHCAVVRLDGTPIPCPPATTIDLTSGASGDAADATPRPSAANLIIMLDRLVDRSDGEARARCCIRGVP